MSLARDLLIRRVSPPQGRANSTTPRRRTMKITFASLRATLKNLMKEEGQDLVEYALVVALIAFAATAGMKTLANNINATFSNLSTSLTSNT